jgi:hypothetical protein
MFRPCTTRELRWLRHHCNANDRWIETVSYHRIVLPYRPTALQGSGEAVSKQDGPSALSLAEYLEVRPACLASHRGIPAFNRLHWWWPVSCWFVGTMDDAEKGHIGRAAKF